MTNFITVPIQGDPLDGSIKPKTDVAVFLSISGFQKLSFLRNNVSKYEWESVRFRIAGTIDAVKAGDVVVHQFPIYNGYRYENEVLSQLKQRRAKVIGMIHDVDYLRFTAWLKEKAQIIRALNEMDLLILTSSELGTILIKDGVTTPFVIRGPWDYLTTAKLGEKIFSRKVVLASNISQSHTGYLSEFPQSVPLTLLGRNFDDLQLASGIEYLGAKLPEELPKFLTGGFGLVWNSEKIDSTANQFGQYMKLTWLHKFSLYLSSGLPVIVQRGTKMAQFVAEKNVGIVIGDLTELETALSLVKELDYQRMAANAANIGNLMQQGHYTKLAVEAALGQLFL